EAHRANAGHSFTVDIPIPETGIDVPATFDVPNEVLWYHTAYFDGQQANIAWSRSRAYDQGLDPAVAVATSGAIEVHKSSQGTRVVWPLTVGGSDKVWYPVGRRR